MEILKSKVNFIVSEDPHWYGMWLLYKWKRRARSDYFYY